MPRRTSRRRFNVFSLAFLDVMSCGFGAVVLIFLVINHRVDDDAKEVDRDMLAESRKLDFLITAGQDNLAELRERLEGALKRVADARRQLLATTEDAERRKKDADDLQARTIAQRESVEELKTDVETREREVKRLQAAEEASAGARARQVKGEGDRQYLTGLYVGGRHILIALDASASMLDSTIVQVLRRRNMAKERQLGAPKWQRAQRTVEWLAAQMPLDSNFQIAVFNAEARFLLPSSAWHEVLHPTAINDALEALAGVVPAGGSSLASLAGLVAGMAPLPDNVFLVTDGLPTRGERPPRSPTVTGRQRVRLFTDAVRLLPKGMPVNPILLPLEGDPQASSAYWALAAATGGTYMSPSADWP